MLINRRGALFAAVTSAGVMLSLSAGPVSAETLSDAIAMAYDSNPTLQSQRALLRALDESWVQARAGFRPSANETIRATYQEIRTPGARPGQSISRGNAGSSVLSFSQPIYTGGRAAANLSGAEADILEGRENLRRSETQVVAQVVVAYVDVRRDLEGLRIRQENVKVLRRQLEESKARFEVGEITRTDVAQSEARLAASVAQLQSQQAQLDISRANYRAVVGQAPGDLAPEPSLGALLPDNVDQAYDAAERDNGQIRAAQYNEQSSRAAVAEARAERMPSVSLQGSVGHSGLVDPLHTDTYSRNLTGSAVVTIPLFSGGATSSRIRAAIERNNSARIGVEIARRAVQQSLTQAWSTLIAARGNIDSTEQQVRAARIAAEGVHQEQQVGLRTTLDVLNAEQELRSAELAQISARHDEYVAAANVLGQMGKLEARNLTPNVPRYDPRANFNKLRLTWGWVPWEEPIAIVDSIGTPKTVEKPLSTSQATSITPPK
jgi:outer membrane protein